MAIAIHALSSGGHNSINPMSFNHTIGAGANLVLYVAAIIDASGDQNPTASSDLDGAFTSSVGEVIASAGNQALAVWRKVNPTVGTHSITIDADNNAATAGIALTLSDVDQTTPDADAGTNGGQGTSRSVTVANAAAGNLVVDFVAMNMIITSVAAGANQTEQVNTNTGDTGTAYGCSTQTGADGGVMSWSWLSTQRTALVAFRAIAAGGAAAPRRAESLLVGLAQ